MNFSATKNGKDLAQNFYTLNEETRTFSTDEDLIMCDFSDFEDITIKTGFGSTVKTGSHSTVKTGPDSTVKTGSHSNITTGNSSTVITERGSTVTTGKNCVVIRKDTFEVYKFEKPISIKLNGYKTSGYEEIKPKHIITIDGKEIELSHESFESLKEQLL